VCAGFVFLVAGFSIFISSWGLSGGATRVGAVAALVLTLAEAAITPALWMLASLGMGIAGTRLLAKHAQLCLCLCVGVGIHLTAAHLIGALGLYAEPVRLFSAWAPIGIGLVLLAAARVELAATIRRCPLGWPALFASPAIALLLVACAQPPGAIWASEAHDYDSLAYHLQLPREWLAMGAIRPLEHNVYSFLPSYMEAAFTQLMAMRPSGPLEGSMSPLFSAHLLHALMALASACVVGRFVSERVGEGAGRWALSVMVSVPWVGVVSSLSYNEMAVVLCASGALIAMFDAALSPVRKGVLIGFLMGVAVCVKPSAMFGLAVPVGAGMLVLANRRTWAKLFFAAGVVGAVTLVPWLVRNALHSGNPVFPFFTDIFGTAHWTQEQAARWAGAHRANAGIGERLMMLAGERGFGHRQWGIFAPAAAIGLLATLISSRTRRTATVLAVILAAQIIAWLSVGHLQSRFLLPTVPIAAAIVAMSVRTTRARLMEVMLALVVLVLGALSITNYLGERRNNPNWALIPGARVFTESLTDDPYSTTPAAYIRSALPEDARVLLVGDSAALYFPDSAFAHSTWDNSPFGDALEQANGEIGPAITALRDAGFTHALVNRDEIARLTSDGWYDPRVSVENASALIEASGEVHAWVEGRVFGTHLIRLVPGGAQQAP